MFLRPANLHSIAPATRLHRSPFPSSSNGGGHVIGLPSGRPRGPPPPTPAPITGSDDGPMSETQPPSPSSWSAIPLDLAGLVLRLLPACADRARFAAVCPQWRAAELHHRVLPVLPLLALPDGTFYSLPYSKRFRFPGCGFAGYNSACGRWLAFLRDDGCFLVDPFTGATVTLPALSDVRLRPPHADLKHIPEHERHTRGTWLLIRNADTLLLSKLMLCSPNLAAAFVCHEMLGQILLCRPGATSCSVRAYDECKDYKDMAFYQGKLYAIDYGEDLFVVNIGQDESTGDPQISRIGRIINGDPCDLDWTPSNSTIKIKVYLVESCGKLLMIRRKIWCRLVLDHVLAGESEFEVFEADFKRSRWVSVTTLGEDQVVFVGRSCSRAVPVSQYGMKGDRIFFLDDDEYYKGYSHKSNETSIGVYDMIDGEVSSPLPMVSWKRDRDRNKMRQTTWLLP
ncbi:uncharacterized protein LOC125533814 [Triticum urartu]|nr:uncharacterized protein LOC125533814 [Triticum urartu]